MNRLVLTAPEAAKAAEGTLTEIRRPVEDPPRFWSFWRKVDGSEVPSGYRTIRASECSDPLMAGMFAWSIDPRIFVPPRRSPLGKPGDLLWVAESFAVENIDDDGERVVWQADMGAARRGRIGEVFYLPSDYEPEAPWQASESMPQWASRTTLRLTAVRAERTGDVWEWVYAVEKV